MKNFLTENQELYDDLSNIYEFGVNFLLYGSAFTALTGIKLFFYKQIIRKFKCFIRFISL